MKIRNRWYLIPIVVALGAAPFVVGLVRGDAGTVPLSDGMTLTYRQTFGDPKDAGGSLGTRTVQFRVQKKSKYALLVTPTVIDQSSGDGEAAEGLPPDPELLAEFTVDMSGIVTRGGGLIFPRGSPSLLWLPEDARKTGQPISGQLWSVGAKTLWNGHEVWPVGFSGPGWERYYDATTGFLLGWENRRGPNTLMLVDTSDPKLKSAIVSGAR